MHKLMDYICEQMEELERKADKDGKLSMAEIEYLDKLAHIKKSLLTSEAMWEDSEFSEAGGSYGSYARGGQGGGSSRGGQGGGRSNAGSGAYARGRGRGARRDSMGRYSRDGGSYEGGSYEGGYSGADDFRMELQELMQDAPNEQIRMKLQRLMSEM